MMQNNEESLSIKKRKNEFYTDDQIAHRNKSQRLYRSSNDEKRLQNNAKHRVGNLNDAEIKKRREQKNKRYKLTRAEVTRNHSKESGLIVKWDYTNPCEL